MVQTQTKKEVIEQEYEVKIPDGQWKLMLKQMDRNGWTVEHLVLAHQDEKTSYIKHPMRHLLARCPYVQ